MEVNNSIKCDVTKCMHNCGGENCELSMIKVTCSECGGCTCCGSFSNKEQV